MKRHRLAQSWCGLLFSCGILCAASPPADYPRQWFLNAHNCYPKDGKGTGRLERARRAGLSAFEEDLAWSEARSRTVASHTTQLSGSQPSLADYFFAPMLPRLRKMPPGKPGILLLLDFKSRDPRPVQEVRAWLTRHRRLLTTYGKRGDRPQSTPVRWEPLTVLLTGDQDAIALFERLTPEGEPYLAMGNREPADRQFHNNVADYIPQPATAFYRVFNFNWQYIEGQPNSKAGAFTPAERARLRAFVEAAQAKGYWLRAWTLNATDSFWGTEEDFGSQAALLERWRACREAGVENIATDEYELAGEFLRGEK
jgi:Glutathione S-transferase, C-terminal domain